MFNIFRKQDTTVGSAAYWKQRAESAERAIQRQIGFTAMASESAAKRKLELQKLQKACSRKARQLVRIRGENRELNRVLAGVDWSKQQEHPFFASPVEVAVETTVAEARVLE